MSDKIILFVMLSFDMIERQGSLKATTMIILVTGTPGCGKSRLCSQIMNKINSSGQNAKTLNISELIKSEKLYEKYDPKFDTFIIDEQKVKRYLNNLLEQHYNPKDLWFIETHTVDAIPKKGIDLVVVLSCRTETLYDRLVERCYNKKKIDENMECEIMRIVLEEASVRYGTSKVLELPSNTEEDLEDNLEIIIERIDEISKKLKD